MKELKKDLFDCIAEPDVDAICITTNGMVDELTGLACMGGGCARVCADKYPETPKRLGILLKKIGKNLPFILGGTDRQGNWIDQPIAELLEIQDKCLIFSFPTIDDLWDGAKIELIKQSALLMVSYTDKLQLRKIASVRFGSGIGSLDWYQEVYPVVNEILDDRFIICCQEKDELKNFG